MVRGGRNQFSLLISFFCTYPPHETLYTFRRATPSPGTLPAGCCPRWGDASRWDASPSPAGGSGARAFGLALRGSSAVADSDPWSQVQANPTGSEDRMHGLCCSHVAQRGSEAVRGLCLSPDTWISAVPARSLCHRPSVLRRGARQRTLCGRVRREGQLLRILSCRGAQAMSVRPDTACEHLEVAREVTRESQTLRRGLCHLLSAGGLARGHWTVAGVAKA